ncbi:MAG: hypothetical protein D6729_18105 [Deltaproteobacteria bacterium]|nr:MAG: hypothetical protein D6729_18105 [Deltaproteobacteria bacterium]
MLLAARPLPVAAAALRLAIVPVPADHHAVRWADILALSVRAGLDGAPGLEVIDLPSVLAPQAAPDLELWEAALRALEAGRTAYDALALRRAAKHLTWAAAAFESAPGRLRRGGPYSETLALLGAIHVLEDEAEQAKAPLERLALFDPTYRMDPERYPPPVIAAFEAARARLQAQPAAPLRLRCHGTCLLYVDDEAVGLGPEVALSRPPGPHIVRAEWWGHFPAGLRVALPPDGAEAELAPTEGPEVALVAAVERRLGPGPVRTHPPSGCGR